jgi:hypothetical protein
VTNSTLLPRQHEETEEWMPLPWVRLDTTFPSNPKLLAMLAEKDGHRAGLVYLCSLAYSGAHGTDGFIPREALTHIHCRLSDATRLVKHGLWEDQAGGWLIHDWMQFQESSLETQQRRQRAQNGAAARWDGHEPASGRERTRQWRERQREKGSDDAP